MNKVIAYQRANEKSNFLVEIYPFSTDIKSWNINEKITLCPVLTSSNIDFTQKFLSEIDKYASGARVLPVYTEPYLEEKPRNFFEQLSTARDMGIKGVILYNSDYINREFADALRFSVFNTPNEEKTNPEGLIQMNYKDDEDMAEEKTEVTKNKKKAEKKVAPKQEKQGDNDGSKI